LSKTKLQEYGESVIMLNLVSDQHKYRATNTILNKHAENLPESLKAELKECIDSIECQKQEAINIVEKKIGEA
jgi:hypothetical protein